MKAQISNIQRYSVNDGYGIRTIVFLMGCTMRCAWCQNPETIYGKPALMFIPDSCVSCGACASVCITGAMRLANGQYGVDRLKCTSCFQCTDECYFGARKASCQEMDVDEVFAEVMKDESFFRNSGGGLTISGGEPLAHPKFCQALLRMVHEAGIHTAVETAGNVPYAAFIEVLPATDLFLFDIKLLDEEKHMKWTGVSNRTILTNLKRLVRTSAEVIVRVPLMPGINDGDEFDAIADYAAALPGVEELHILPYHTLGESKYDQLDLAYTMPPMPEENDAEVERCRAYAAGRGLRVSVGGAGFPSSS